MDCEKDDAVRLREIKERVREAAHRASPETWIKAHPGEALTGAFLAGLSAGGGSKGSPSGMVGKVGTFLLKYFL